IFKLKKAAKDAGIDTEGLSKEDLIEALEGGSKSKSVAKGGKAPTPPTAKGGKALSLAKGGKGGTAAAAAVEASTAPKKKKTKAPKSDDGELSLESLLALTESLRTDIESIRTDFDDFVANLAASADKPSKEVATSKPAAKGKAKKEPVDPVEAARAVLSDYRHEEGSPVI